MDAGLRFSFSKLKIGECVMKDVRIGKFTLSRDFLLFLIANALLGITIAVESSFFANRLAEDLEFTIRQRGLLEFPRELPGLLVVFIAGALSFLGDIRTAAVANIFGGLGLLAFGLVSAGFWPVVVTMIIFSTGQHIYLPLQGALSMTFANKGNFGRRLGEIQSVGTLAMILTLFILPMLLRNFGISLAVTFTIGAIAMVLAGIVFLFMTPSPPRPKKQRIVYNKKFMLFYVMSMVFGARRQVTFTFATWLLVTVYYQPAYNIGTLFMIMSIISVPFRPFMGVLIDKMGERFALMFESAILVISALGFAFARTLFSPAAALIIVSVCLIVDNLFNIGAGMARTTYVKRISANQHEASGTLTFSISLDHIVTMSMPFLLALIWERNIDGYRFVFLGAAVFSIAGIFLANKIRIPKESEVESA